MPGLSSLQVNIKDQPHNLAWINEAEQALLKDLGGSGRPGPMGIPSYEDQDDFSDDDEEAAGYEGTDASTSDDPDYDTDLDEDYASDQEDISGGMGGGTGSTGGAGGGGWSEPDDPHPEDFSWSVDKGFTGPTETSETTASDLETIGVENIEDLATMEDMYANPDAYGVGYNDFLDMGFFEKSEERDYGIQKEEAAALQKSLREKHGLDVKVDVDRANNYTYTGPDATQAIVGQMAKGAFDFSITGMVAKAVSAIADYWGINKKDVTKEQVKEVLNDPTVLEKKSAPERAGSPIDAALDPTGIGAAYAAQSSPREEEQAAFASMMGEAPAFFDPTVDFSNREDDRNIDAETGIELSDDITNQMGFGDPGSTSWTEDDQLNYDINALNNSREEYESPYGTADSIYSMNFPNDDPSQLSWGGEDDWDDGGDEDEEKYLPPVIPLPPVEPEEPPKTALQLYFERLNKRRGTTASNNPYYLEGSAAGNMASFDIPRNPIDNANYRRNLALATPTYREPSGQAGKPYNHSVATFAAAYGMTYDEAAKRFAPPSVPAMGGGGLRGLMEYS